MEKSVWMKIRLFCLTAAVVSLMAAALVYAGTSSEGILKGLETVSRLLIPSLFPMMVLSSLLIRSGLSDVCGRLLAPVTRWLFRLPGEASSAILLSFIGGFPIGAKCVRLLYEQRKLTDAQAEQMMLFCICSGPAFLITGVGTLLLGNPAAGVILYLSQIISGLCLGFVAGRISERNAPATGEERPAALARTSLSDAFLLSCSDGAAALIQLTALVVMFSMWLSLSEKIGLSQLFSQVFQWAGLSLPTADAAFPVIFEVTTACQTISRSACPLWVLSFAAGFGGLCVHFQIFSLLGNIRYNKWKVLGFRFINACFSSFLVYVIGWFYHPDAAVFAVWGGENAEYTSTSAVGAAALMVLSVVFVLSLKRSEISVGTFRRRFHSMRHEG